MKKDKIHQISHLDLSFPIPLTQFKAIQTVQKLIMNNFREDLDQ